MDDLIKMFFFIPLLVTLLTIVFNWGIIKGVPKKWNMQIGELRKRDIEKLNVRQKKYLRKHLNGNMFPMIVLMFIAGIIALIASEAYELEWWMGFSAVIFVQGIMFALFLPPIYKAGSDLKSMIDKSGESDDSGDFDDDFL